jgi:hypothetical protein
MTEPFLGISFLSVIKTFIIFANFIYIVFAIVVVRQVKLMTDTLELGYEGFIKMISYLHLGFAIVILLYSFLTL